MWQRGRRRFCYAARVWALWEFQQGNCALTFIRHTNSSNTWQENIIIRWPHLIDVACWLPLCSEFCCLIHLGCIAPPAVLFWRPVARSCSTRLFLQHINDWQERHWMCVLDESRSQRPRASKNKQQWMIQTGCQGEICGLVYSPSPLKSPSLSSMSTFNMAAGSKTSKLVGTKRQWHLSSFQGVLKNKGFGNSSIFVQH